MNVNMEEAVKKLNKFFVELEASTFDVFEVIGNYTLSLAQATFFEGTPIDKIEKVQLESFFANAKQMSMRVARYINNKYDKVIAEVVLASYGIAFIDIARSGREFNEHQEAKQEKKKEKKEQKPELEEAHDTVLEVQDSTAGTSSTQPVEDKGKDEEKKVQ